MNLKQILWTSLKIVCVGVIAALIAFLIGISNYLLVGILAILCVSPTKKDSLVLGVKRYLDVVMALLLSTLLFVLLGFELYTFVIFLFLFALLSYLGKIEIGMIPGIVLVNHVYSLGQFDVMFLLEEILIITVAVISSLAVNTLFPEFWLKKMTSEIIKIDQKMQDHLYMLSIVLSQEKDFDDFKTHFEKMGQKIYQEIEKAEKEDKNRVFSNELSYVAYLYMRRNQLNYMNHMYQSAFRLTEFHNHQLEISEYIKNLVKDIGDENKADLQMEKLNILIEKFKAQNLPKTRSEFETRALLYHILTDLRSMLIAKSAFHKRYPEFKL